MGDSSFFKLNENTMFSQLNKKELQEILRALDKFYIDYVDKIGLNYEDTFGVEIEYKGVPRKLIDFYVDENMRDYRSVVEWQSIDEPNLIGGGEVTSRILHDEKESWLELKKICQFLKDNKSNNLIMAGGHVHAWAGILGNDHNNWRRLAKMYAYFEPILYHFGTGDKINLRESIFRMAYPVSDDLISKMWRFEYAKSMNDIKSALPMHTKYLGLNFKHVLFNNLLDYEGNTIEFRFPNATIEEVIWQNNIRVFVSLLVACTQKIDEEFLDEKIREEEFLLFSFNSREEALKRYRRLDLRRALLFADMVFNNNYDKACFLRQYTKGFQRSNEESLVLARKFIR